MNAAKVVEDLKQRFPNEPEYIQAVSQVLPTTTSTLSSRRLTLSSVCVSPIVFASSASLG